MFLFFSGVSNMKSSRLFLHTAILCFALGGMSSSALAEEQEPPMGPPPADDGNAMPPPPPDGGPGPGGMPPPGARPPPGGMHKPVVLKGSYVVAGGKVSLSGKSFTSSETDTSAIWVKDKGDLSLAGVQVSTTGNTSSNEGSSFQGLNAAVLASNGGKVLVQKGQVVSSGSGANGLFATGKDSVVQAADVTIRATGDGGHGIMTSFGGTISFSRGDIYTTNIHGAAIATDRGGGTITADNSKLVTTGRDSPMLYSTGKLIGRHLTGEALVSEAIVIEGQNSVALEDSVVAGSKNGAMLYQSFSGDAHGFGADLKMKGGSFVAKKGALIFVTNNQASVTLSGVRVEAASGIIAKASADRWGRTGSNGGHLTLMATGETLNGNLVADAISSIDATLTGGTVLSGAVENASLTIDGPSKWVVKANSSLKSLSLPNVAAIGTIVGNGFTVTYDATNAKNAWLGGKTYPLQCGGTLQPK